MDSSMRHQLVDAYNKMLNERDGMIDNLSGIVPSPDEATVWVDSLILGVLAEMQRALNLEGDVRNSPDDLIGRIRALAGVGERRGGEE
jgi:hypothetical protein